MRTKTNKKTKSKTKRKPLNPNMVYAVYRGDTFITVGKRDEVTESMGWNKQRFLWQHSKAARKRVKLFPGSLELIEIGVER